MSENRTKAHHSWAKLLNPDELRSNLILAAIFLTAYEFLAQALIEPLKSFFADGFDSDGLILGEEYRTNVASLHKMPFFASALWFRNAGALTDSDIERFKAIRDHRNFIAHNVPAVLGSIDSDVRIDLLDSIVQMVSKIDMWWIREIEIPTRPEFDSVNESQIDAENVFSMRMALLGLLREVAGGNDESLRRLYEEFSAKRVVH